MLELAVLFVMLGILRIVEYALLVILLVHIVQHAQAQPFVANANWDIQIPAARLVL